MKATITGQILRIDEVQTFDSGFTKREMVVMEADQRYDNPIKMAVIKEKCGDLDQYNEGDMVTVDCFINGNEHNDKYYVEVRIARVTHAGGQREEPECPI